MFRSLALTALLASLSLRVGAAEGDYIWVEGESATKKQLSSNSWYESVKKGQLSGGDWVANWGATPGLVDYSVDSPKDGEYTLWVRANWIGAALAFKVGDADWKEVDFSKRVDDLIIAADDKPDMRALCWVDCGKVKLKKGANPVSWKMHSGNNNCGAIDCFLFANKPFAPSGASQPGKKLGLAEPGTWAFEPDLDEFDPKSLLDLRSLNEKKAGESGWIQKTKDGDFALGNGKPVRFWAANDNVYAKGDDALKSHARFLAKRGINMVRFFADLNPNTPGAKITDVRAGVIEGAQRNIAAMKEEGIYTLFTIYWGSAEGAQESFNIPGRKSGSMLGLLFWDETVQNGYKAWVKELLTRPNPYAGGVPIGQDPGMAIFQIQNEDSLLFWTMLGPLLGNAAEWTEENKRLREAYGKWAIKKYGSMDKAKEAWKGEGAGGDDFGANLAGFKPLWEYNNDVSGSQRYADQLQFLSETMRDFNQMIVDYIHKDLKCPVLINAGNWRTANQVKMLDCERWSYGATDIMAVNRYVDFVHQGPRAGYMVMQGDHYVDGSVLTHPRFLAVSDKQVAGLPFLVTESTWVPPMSYQSEGPFLVSAYSSLNGVDAYYWFALGSVGYDPTINKWQAASPAVMGGWPAASWMFRKNYIKKGEPAVHEERTLDDVWHGRGIIIAEDEGFDPGRDSGSMPKESNVKSGANPLAFLVGPVEVVYGGDPAKSKVADLGKYIDDQKQTVTSNTGELTFDYGTGLCRLDAPKAQGATGFFTKSGTVALSTVSIDSKNEYATFLAVALDDQELKQSKKILLQATTQCRPYHWKQSPADFTDNEKHQQHGFVIEDTGQPPWNVIKTDATIAIKNPKLSKATILDPNGMPMGNVAGAAQKGGVFVLTMPADALYVIVE
jgi:hypothetical protein